MSDDLSQRLQAYLADKLGARDLVVANLARIHGGASRETYRFRAKYNGRDRGLILRRDPVASLIETERSTEFRAYQAFHKLGLPVPEPIALELDGGAIGDGSRGWGIGGSIGSRGTGAGCASACGCTFQRIGVNGA